MTIDPIYVIASFAGGIFGACFGGIPVFILCGISVIGGTIITLATGDPTFNNIVTWGPFLGPHVAFAGAIAAAAIAGKQGRLDSGRNVLKPLFSLNRPEILIIGGIFGTLGYFLNLLFNKLPAINGIASTDTIALSLTINTILIRILFFKTKLFNNKTEIFNPPAQANEESGELNYSYSLQLIVLSISIGLLGAFVAKYLPGSTGLVFGFCAFSLIFLYFHPSMPITHHIALCAEYYTFHTGSIWWGLAAGVLAAILAEVFTFFLLPNNQSHIDPPAISIIILFTLCPLLSISGIFTLSAYFPLILIVVTGTAGFFLIMKLKTLNKATIY